MVIGRQSGRIHERDPGIRGCCKSFGRIFHSGSRPSRCDAVHRLSIRFAGAVAKVARRSSIPRSPAARAEVPGWRGFPTPAPSKFYGLLDLIRRPGGRWFGVTTSKTRHAHSFPLASDERPILAACQPSGFVCCGGPCQTPAEQKTHQRASLSHATGASRILAASSALSRRSISSIISGWSCRPFTKTPDMSSLLVALGIL